MLPERTRHRRMERLGRLRSGEERLARLRLQEALASRLQAEERVALCRAAYREIMVSANERLKGVIDLTRLPLVQLMVSDARRAMHHAETALLAASKVVQNRQAEWQTARQAERVMERAVENAGTALHRAVERVEQGRIDEVVTLRFGR
ncbi:MAG: flagellar FliJ family protein [bacterium]